MQDRTFRGIVLLVLMALLISLLLTGCGGGEKGYTEEMEEQSAETETSESETGEKEALEVGDTATFKDGTFTVNSVAPTGDITSSEAASLLLTSEPGEGTNSSKTPAAGNEFLMVTMIFKNTGSSKIHAIAPANVKLTDSSGKEYQEVTTSGYGGIYNGKPIEPGSEGTTTAIYEVPAGKTGLTLTFTTDDYKDFEFEIR